MSARLFALAMLICIFAGSVLAGSTGKRKGAYEQPFIESTTTRDIPSRPMPPDDLLHNRPLVGTSTSLTGWYDYQSNGGAVQEIRVNPANGNIHVTRLTAFDSTASTLDASRRVAYAMSSDGGSTWDNFSSLYVPARRGGFPTITLGTADFAGAPIIADHSVIGSGGVQATIFIDFPEGGGQFAEITPPSGFGSDEAIWPYVASASDGSVIMAASRSTAATAFYARTADFISWSPLTQVTQVTQSGGRYPVQANGTGRVGILYNTSNGTAALGNWWLESTNNGVSWSTPVNIFSQRFEGADTLNSYVHCDFVYNGNTPLFVFSEYSAGANSDREDIVFWSQATGFRVAVPYDPTKYFVDPINQRFHGLSLGWPSIGLSGNTIVVAFQAFQQDVDSTASHRYQYSDVWFTQSNDGGLTWTPAQNITNTQFVDERYPSVSKWNAPGQANMVWIQKNKSGLYAFPGGADTVRTTQMYYKHILAGVKTGGGTPSSFQLEQNYPNPFNPATKINYTVDKAGPVSIKVYNTLGQEVATLLNQNLQPGSYQVTFDGSALASGMYIYKMTAGSFSQSRKMVLTK